MSDDHQRVRAMTVAELRARIEGLPDGSPVYVQIIVGGDLVTNDARLMDAQPASDVDGYFLRLLPDPGDEFDTRRLIDDGIEFRQVVTELLDEHGDCFEGQLIHQWVGDGDDAECADDCTGCCADDVIKRLRELTVTAEDAPGE